MCFQRSIFFIIKWMTRLFEGAIQIIRDTFWWPTLAPSLMCHLVTLCQLHQRSTFSFCTHRSWNRALHSELLSEISSWVSSRNEFLRVETRRVERHFFCENENREKTRLPKLAKMKIAKRRDYRNSRKWKSQKNAIFCKN
jgi:hypothetical protein